MAHIVLIDDDECFEQTLCSALEGLGHRVRAALTGQAGLHLVRDAVPDLVITDLLMPDMDGFEVIMQLRATAPELRVIAMSGGVVVHGETLMRMAHQLGACGTLAKPFTPACLVQVVEAALRNLPVERDSALA